MKKFIAVLLSFISICTLAEARKVSGKVISGIAKRSAMLGKPVIAICGSRGDGAEEIMSLGVSELYFSCESEKTFDEIIKTCREDLYNISFKAANEILK